MFIMATGVGVDVWFLTRHTDLSNGRVSFLPSIPFATSLLYLPHNQDLDMVFYKCNTLQ